MKQRFRETVYDFLGFSVGAFVLLLLMIYIIAGGNLVAGFSAYMLSFLFVGSNFFVIRKIHKAEHSEFYRHFFISLSVRFILVLAGVVLILMTTKIHQIYFTVSFIISYIFHSVIEIISINKILETDN